MAVRPNYNLADKASTVAATAGAALTAELCSQAFPDSNGKRDLFLLKPISATTGATPLEAFIDGRDQFRFRVANQSTLIVNAFCVYSCGTNNNDFVVQIVAGVQNRAGTAVLLANSTNVKMPTAATGTCVLTVSGENLIFTCTGTAGDTNGRWSIRMIVEEVTDLG